MKASDVASIDWFLFDLDGVLWRGTHPIEGSPEVLKRLREMGKHIVFVTNNATKSREMCAHQLNQLGYEAHPDEVVCSAFVTARYLAAHKVSGGVYVVGEKGLRDELQLAGLDVRGVSDGEHTHMSQADVAQKALEADIGAVVVGLDTHVNYFKLATGYLLRDPHCLFIATNMDATFPSATGRMLPGAGALVNALATSSGRKPIVMGKPAQPALECIAGLPGFDASRAVMVGDRLDTDIAFGAHGGMRTLLVLSGVTDAAAAAAAQGVQMPTWVQPALSDLLPALAAP